MEICDTGDQDIKLADNLSRKKLIPGVNELYPSFRIDDRSDTAKDWLAKDPFTIRHAALMALME